MVRFLMCKCPGMIEKIVSLLPLELFYTLFISFFIFLQCTIPQHGHSLNIVLVLLRRSGKIIIIFISDSVRITGEASA